MRTALWIAAAVAVGLGQTVGNHGAPAGVGDAAPVFTAVAAIEHRDFRAGHRARVAEPGHPCEAATVVHWKCTAMSVTSAPVAT